MDGQQVYVTGADGEQMVLSGPEAAALLEQAGINLHNGQVLEGGDGMVGVGVDGAMMHDGVDEGAEGEGIVQIPEGSSIQEDGSIIAADGSLLAPPGSVIQGEDGSLIMTQEASLLMQGIVGAAAQLNGGQNAAADTNIYATPDGKFVTATGQVVNADGELTGEMLEHVMDTTAATGQTEQDDGSNAVEEQKVSEEQQEVPQENLAISAAEDSVGKEQTVPESSEQLQQDEVIQSSETVATDQNDGQVVENSEPMQVQEQGQVVQQQPDESNPPAEATNNTAQIDTIATSSESEVKTVTSEPNSVMETDSSAENVVAAPNEAVISEAEQQQQLAAASIAVSAAITSGGQMVYTTADGSLVSAPEGAILTNADGNLVTADGRLLTNADGTPVSVAAAEAGQLLGGPAGGEPENILPTTEHEEVFSSSKSQESFVGSVAASLSTPSDGGIMVSAAGGTIMTATDQANYSVLPSGLLASEDGVISAPEGSIITEDGSLVSADGIVLAPPGSILTEEQQAKQQLQAQQQQQQLEQQQQQSYMPSGNLIGLQLPDENGEVLYLDPNDPAAQILLQEAGITLGEGGVLKTADGQILTNDQGDPITSNLKPLVSTAATATAAVSSATSAAPARNNLVGDAVAAAGLGAEELGSGFQLNTAPTSAGSLDLGSVTGQTSMGGGVQQTKYQKMSYATNNSTLGSTPMAATQSPNLQSTPGLNSSMTTPRMVQQRRTVQKSVKRSSEVNIGPDQQKVTYTVTSENGYSQTYMMICSKSLDQNTLINTLIKNISNDPNHKGKKTIKITQHKYGPKKMASTPATPAQQQQTPQQQFRQQPQPTTVSPTKTVYSRNYVQQQQQTPVAAPGVRQIQQRTLAATPAAPVTPVVQQQPTTPVHETIMPVVEEAPLSLEDFVDQLGDTINNGEAKVIVRCNYCTSFRSVLNSQTWENILNHILPVAREELHTAFYGNILRNFSRGLKIQVLGRTKEICEVNVSHGLVCRRTGAWYQVHKPSIQLAIQLATHIAAVQPGVSGPYGARPRGNSIICLFCSSPYTADDYQKHLNPHLGQIYPCLLLIAGAYCSNSFESEIKKLVQCGSCDEGEHQDLRFLPCSKFAAEYSCTKKLQATVESFRDNFDSRGFLQVSNSAMTKCSVCRNQSPTYCALFKITNPILIQNGPNEMLAVCSNCQKQFVNIVMRENAFDKQLKMFQLHHMEQLCGVLRVLLSVSQKICNGQYNVLYTVQEGGSLYSATNTLHKVVPARLLHLGNSTPTRGVILEENKNIDMAGPSVRFVCEQCKFSIDLTRLEHKQAKVETHLVEMALGVVLEHIVPHTDSLLSVITTASKNEMLDLKFEFTATVEGDGPNRRINVSLDRKILPKGCTAEISIQKDIYKTIEAIKTKLTPDKRGNIKLLNRYVFLDQPQPENLEPNQQVETSIDMNKFLEQAKSLLSLYGAAGCNTRLLDYYSECKLCSKFSFPDFRLTAGMQSRTDAPNSTAPLPNSGTPVNPNTGSNPAAATTVHSSGVALCDNCCETILSLCVPSEPERLMGRGDNCLLLGVERNSGHRLVLSNQAKKWISAEGVENIKTISDVAALSSIQDYSTILIQKFRSYLMAVCSRTWSDPDCVTARAGFTVQPPPPPGQIPPIEVKVTLRPPKSRTPPSHRMSGLAGLSGGRLKITPVPVTSTRGRPPGSAPTISRISSTGRGAVRGSTPMRGMVRSIPMNRTTVTSNTPTAAAQKLVKITANRRIIPVRDPTSISNSPIRTPSGTTMIVTNTPVSAVNRVVSSAAVSAASSTSTPTSSKIMSSTSKYSQQKIDAMREALRASSKAAASMDETGATKTTAAANTFVSSPTAAAAKTSTTSAAGQTAAGGEEDTDFETLEDIANFINSSEPEPGSNSSDTSKPAKSSENQNEEVFSDLQDEFTNNSLKLSSQQSAPQNKDETEQSKQLQTYKLPKGTIVANLTETGEVSTTCSTEVPIPKSLSGEEEGPVRIPSTLRISEVDTGLVKLPGTTPTKPLEQDGESTLSPASDATTSTRSTAAPGATTPPAVSRKLVTAAGGGSPAGELQQTPASSSQTSSAASAVVRQRETQLSKELVSADGDSAIGQTTTELTQEMESLASLNLDLVDTLDLDLEELESMDEKALDALEAGVSPDKQRGMKLSKILQGGGAPIQRRLIDPSTKMKRKRDDEDGGLKSKKRQSYATPEVKSAYYCDVCNINLQEETFTKHMSIHRGPMPFNCNMCGKSFPNKATYKLHSKIHMNGQDTDEEVYNQEVDTPDYMKGLSQSGRVRKAKRMFDL